MDFTYSGITQGNRNPLLYKNINVDGLKTGHTEIAGYGLTASAVRDNRRLILVVNGLTSVTERSRESERLLDYGFREFGNYALFEAGDEVAEADVWLGDAGVVPLVVENSLTVTLPRKARRKMAVTVVYDGPVPAPIVRGTQLAKLVITAPDTPAIEIPLLAGADVGKLSMFRRIGAAVSYLIWGAGS
jgi:D-alanyl-D-alanine carboxypeptidase (penicillin-binding protein 5/6)